MQKKVIIIVALLAAALGGYYWWQNRVNDSDSNFLQIPPDVVYQNDEHDFRIRVYQEQCRNFYSIKEAASDDYPEFIGYYKIDLGSEDSWASLGVGPKGTYDRIAASTRPILAARIRKDLKSGNELVLLGPLDAPVGIPQECQGFTLEALE